MAQRVYATAADWFEFIGGEQPTKPDPDGGDPIPLEDRELNALLRRSSQRIDSLTRASRFDVDDDGYPTDPDISDAFRDATCAQADWFTDTDDVTGALSQEGMVRIGSVQIGGGNAASASNPRSPDDARTSPEVLDILRSAGLLGTATPHS